MSAYLVELSSNPEYTPSPAEIDELKNEVLCFTMASHLLWTFWAFVNLQQDIEFGYVVSSSSDYIYKLPTYFTYRNIMIVRNRDKAI